MLLSIPDARTHGQERVLFLCTHRIYNDCDPGCCCAGGGQDIIDVIFTDAAEAALVWAFDNKFNSQDCDQNWACDMCSSDVAGQVALAAGVHADDVNIVLLALTAVMEPAPGEAMRTSSGFNVFERLMRWSIGEQRRRDAIRAAAGADAEAEDEDEDDDWEEQYREQERARDYALMTYAGQGAERQEQKFVDPYADDEMPIYPGGYAGHDKLPSTGVVPTKEEQAKRRGQTTRSFLQQERLMKQGPLPDGHYLKDAIREQALAWLPTIDRCSLLSVFQATRGWGDRYSVDYHQAEDDRMTAEYEAEFGVD